MGKKTFEFSELVNNPSFVKWAKGTASEAEANRWDRWIAKDSSNRRLAIKAQQKIVGFKLQQLFNSNLNLRWSRLRSEINSSKRARLSEKRMGFNWLFRVAATVLLASLITGGIYFTWFSNFNSSQNKLHTQQVVTEFGERKEINLSDGSTIVLNANSTLKIQTDKKNPSDVEIFFEGEALFNVANRMGTNAVHFIVHTNDGVVKALGTQFIVSTRKGITRVVLKEGSVLIEPDNPSIDKSSYEGTALNPNELAEFSKSSESVKIKRVNPDVYLSWASSRLVFDETPLREVIERIEFTYGLEVMVRDPSLYHEHISGRIENTEWQVIVKSVAKSLSTEYEVVADTVFFGKE